MRKMLLVLLMGVILTACQSPNSSTNKHTIIDWIDFVKIDGVEYHAIHTAAIASNQYIGAEIGKVEFKVDENVTNPGYMVKNGDAAFWEEGTPIFAVVNMPNMVAMKDNNEVNGYRLYQANDVNDNWRFDDMDRTKINEVEVLKGYVNPESIKSYTEKKDIELFLNVLDDGEEDAAFSPNTGDGDPKTYFLTFYTDQPIAMTINIQYDGHTWYWYPWEEEILPDEVGGYLK